MAITSRPPAPSMSGLRLPSYGYLDDIPVYRDPVDIPRIQQSTYETPDLVKIQFGAGTRASWDRCCGLRMVKRAA